jgi:hypothetical protein
MTAEVAHKIAASSDDTVEDVRADWVPRRGTPIP